MLAEYNTTVVEQLFENFASSEHQKVCNRILEILKKTPKITAKRIQAYMKWADIREIHLALDLMAQMQILGSIKGKRSVMYFVTKSES